MKTNPYPWGTMILLPLVMTSTEPLVFEPRPKSVPRFTAGNNAAVGANPSGTV